MVSSSDPNAAPTVSDDDRAASRLKRSASIAGALVDLGKPFLILAACCTVYYLAGSLLGDWFYSFVIYGFALLIVLRTVEFVLARAALSKATGGTP